MQWQERTVCRLRSVTNRLVNDVCVCVYVCVVGSDLCVFACRGEGEER